MTKVTSMSLTDISSSLLDTTFTLQRRINTLNSVGDPVESWSDLETGIRGTVQPVKVSEIPESLQGTEYSEIYKIYLTIVLTNAPVDNDKMVDASTSVSYDVKSVQLFKASRAGVVSGNHYKLFVTVPRAPKS